jgi:hypothetical protein
MMTTISRRRLQFATAGFLSEMRKAHARLHPDAECPIKNLEDYAPEQRSALMAAVQKAMTLAAPESDVFFTTWEERQTSPVE